VTAKIALNTNVIFPACSDHYGTATADKTSHAVMSKYSVDVLGPVHKRNRVQQARLDA